MSALKRTGVIAAGLALFSMFFGAGDLIWPLILGGTSGDKNFFAMLGLLLTGVSLPLLGLIAMMLFEGDYRAFFGQTGKVVGAILIFAIQAILGPFGSIPRLITLSHATLKPYMGDWMTLAPFSVIACGIVFLFLLRKKKMIEILGYVLTPVLLLALGLILFLGLRHPPAPSEMDLTNKEAFLGGLNVGYNTLDLIASFIFAPLVLSHFIKDGSELQKVDTRKAVFKKMLKSCLLAAFLLSSMYVGLTYISSYYTPFLTPGHAPEARLAEISQYLLGSVGAFVSCIAVSLSCLTTAIPIAVISTEYIQKDLLRNRGGAYLPAILALGISAVIANFGFMGIAAMLSPILQILCPGLIVLSVLNIFHKLYEMPMRKVPVFAAFALSIIGYIVR